ncbi:MAG: ATP-dependent Clp protease adaptor ClpS [Bdellovibrionales bacterium]
MPIDVINKPPARDVKRKSKIDKPRKYQVVHYNDLPITTSCHADSLRKVFKISAEEACDLAMQAAEYGQSVVCEEPFEVAEERAIQGNRELGSHSDHNPFVALAGFVTREVG